ncbi:hypothetical protein, partial [Sphingomonas sp. NPDC079357]|uniref:hypothetical protein n=1 Tax=Sphingomonas sp. NPDC079357 TaxID=3364518 RepID=UPI00384EF3FA
GTTGGGTTGGGTTGGGTTGGGTTGGGTTGGGTTGGGTTGGGTNGGGTTGGGTTGGGTNVVTNPVIVQQARVLVEKATQGLPGTTETRNLPHQSIGSFESSPSFGWLGKEQLPGNRTVVMHFATDVQADTGTGAAGLSAPGAVKPADEEKQDACQVGGSRNMCGPVVASGLPYPGNSVITPMVRFTTR